MISYDSLIRSISETAPGISRSVIRIDLKTLSMTIDTTPIVKDGKVVHPDAKSIEIDMRNCGSTMDDIIRTLSIAYVRYRNSRPTAYSDRHKSRYFTALAYEDLPTDAREFGAAREVEQFKLEYLLLMLACQTPKNVQALFPDGRYFWTPKKGSPLIIRKDWFPASLFEQ